MGFFNEIGNKSAVVSKINKLNQSIKADYAELGLRYYNVFKDNPDPVFEEIVNKIKNSYVMIAEAEKELALIKGIIVCDKCGSECSKELNFCVSCGNKLNKSVVSDIPSTDSCVTAHVESGENSAVSDEKQDESVNDKNEDSAAEDAVAPEEPIDLSLQDFKFCTQCGTKVASTAIFCTNCGSKLRV